MKLNSSLAETPCVIWGCYHATTVEMNGSGPWLRKPKLSTSWSLMLLLHLGQVEAMLGAAFKLQREVKRPCVMCFVLL